MSQGSALLSPQPVQSSKAEPCLQLLMEFEPRGRVFFRNFFDLLSRRKEPALLASQPIQCSRHFYVRTGVRWSAIAESIAWHLAAAPLLLILWTWSMQWDSPRFPMRRVPLVESKYELTYYRPDETFPARDGRQPQDRTPDRASRSGQGVLKVAAENRAPGIDAPNVPMTENGKTEIASSNPTLPAVPLAATTRTQLALPADSAELIAPTPASGTLSMRAFGSPGRSVVAPAPQIAGLQHGGGITLPDTVVAPAPALRGSPRRGGLGSHEIGSAAVVPPSPELAQGKASGATSGLSRGFGVGSVGALATAIVPPPPSVRGRSFTSGARGGAGNGSGFEVVAPSPALANGLVLASGRGNSLGGGGSQVVPPAPALGGRVSRAGGGRGGRSERGNGNEVIGPAPSLGSGVALARGNGNSLVGGGTQVVAPAPSLAGTGRLGGGGGKSEFGTINGTAVAPTPGLGEMAVHGDGGRGRGFGSLNGDGAPVVGPVPTIAASRVGSGNGGSGGTGFADLGSQVLPPSLGGRQGTGTGGSGQGGSGLNGSASGLGGNGSGGGTAGSGTGTMAGLAGGPAVGSGGGSSSTPIISSAVPKQAIPDVPAGKTEVLPLRVVQLALALPMSSFFSNYEAFVAERSVNHSTSQLIKLVYIFLPYQRRLTEIGVNTSKTFHLRVTRDPSCDESLISMTWPEGEKRDKPDESDKEKLPCYRTTADDYRKAWEKAR